MKGASFVAPKRAGGRAPPLAINNTNCVYEKIFIVTDEIE
jgi:hypothetical protein